MPYLHYGREWLPLVPNALGEAFSECNTRGRASGVSLHGKDVFPKSRKSYTQGRLSREPF